MSTLKIDRDKKYFSVVTVFLFTLLIMMALSRILLAWYGNLLPDHVSSAWINLAHDFSEGILYRPLYSPETGYGGTRFMPLFFVSCSLLSNITGDLLSAGYILNILVISGIIWALFFLLREQGGSISVILLIMACLLISPTIHAALASIRGDLLAVCFSLWGLYFALKAEGKENNPLLIAAAILFSLAFFTKLTSLHGFAAVALWLVLKRMWRSALLFGLVFAFIVVAGLGVIHIASNGSFFENILFSASGGAALRNILRAPLQFVTAMMIADVPVLICFILAVALFCYHLRELWRSLAGIYLIITLAVTVTIFGSPGIWSNHLLDLHAASVLFTGFIISQKRHELSGFLLAQMIIVVGVSLIPQTDNLKIYYGRVMGSVDYINIIKEKTKAGCGDILSEYPMVPLVLGEPVYIHDAFMLRLIVQRDRTKAEPLLDRIRHRDFRFIFMLSNIETNREWYRNSHFGDVIIEEILKYYYLDGLCGPYYIYRSKK